MFTRVHDPQLTLGSALKGLSTFWEGFRVLGLVGIARHSPFQSSQGHAGVTCLQVIVYPSYLVFLLVLAVVPQRDSAAAPGVMALHISFPTPFPSYA